MFASIFSFGLVGIAFAGSTVDWQSYENGALGRHPQKEFHSAPDVSAPLVHVEYLDAYCESEAVVLLCPDGPRVPGNKALMLDRNGDLVWHHKEYGTVKSLQVQNFKGRPHLTFWVGDDNFASHGHGYYKMLDESYSLVYTISALNGHDADFHEFTITPENTALITSYQKREWSFNKFGKETGWIWDCLFQEIDFENNKLLFEWTASDHYTFDDMSVNSWDVDVGTKNNPWDWFHLNSVQKDPWGNYLIAARYTNAISYIDGVTGKPLWHIGGKLNSFTDLTHGNASAFVDPHHARWVDSYSAITVYDNVNFRLKRDAGISQSVGLRITLEKLTQKVIETMEFSHPARFFAMSEGSMQRLDNGNYFVGYGSASVYAEFAPNGTLVCTANYSPTNASAEEGQHGALQSYRIFKQSWVGHPTSLPSTKISKQKLYVSWNGATQVHSWRLVGNGGIDDPSARRIDMGTTPKTGFETIIDIHGDMHSTYRLTALDKDGGFIRSWDVHADGHIWEIFLAPARSRALDLSKSFLLLVLSGCTCLLAWINRKYIFRDKSGYWHSRRRSRVQETATLQKV